MGYDWLVLRKDDRGSIFALITFLLAFVVILLGAYTRLTDAGLSCPDWPHCYGFIAAPHTSTQMQIAIQRYPLLPIDIAKAWTEMTHRYFAGTEGILILLLTFPFLLRNKAKNIRPTLISVALISLLASQVILGMLTVTEKLRPVIVLSHLLTGLSILSLLWWMYLDSRARRLLFNQTIRNQNTKMWLWMGLVVIVMQITLGGWVSTHYAGLACIGFPYCNGVMMPHLQLNNLNTDLITIHMLHRIGAAITALYFLFLGHLLLRDINFRLIGIMLLSFITLQVALGIINILWLRPVWIALAHQFVGTLLLLTIISGLVKVSKGSHHVSYVT